MVEKEVKEDSNDVYLNFLYSEILNRPAVFISAEEMIKIANSFYRSNGIKPLSVPLPALIYL